MSLKREIRETVERGDLERLEAVVAEEPGSVRFLLGLMYDLDEQKRSVGVKGLAMVAKHHPKQAKKLIERLVWAMSKDAGAYVPNAPEVLAAIADESPDLLVPVAPDLVRLSKDPTLNEGVCGILRTVVSRCPGKIGRGLSDSLKKSYLEGEPCG